MPLRTTGLQHGTSSRWNEAHPTALAVVGVPTVRGKQALREYWNKAVARIGSLRFTVDRVLWDAGARELAIIYDSEIDGRKRRVSET